MRTPQEIIPIRLPEGFSRFVLLLTASKGGTGKSTLATHLGVAALLIATEK